MPKKDLLLVADHLTAEDWKRDLARDYTCAEAHTVVDALDHLKAHPDTALLVQENLAIIPNERALRAYPKEFDTDKVDQHDRGAALIQYARDNGLISSNTPAYLARMDGPQQGDPPPHVTKVVETYADDMAAVLKPPLHRPAAPSRKGGRS